MSGICAAYLYRNGRRSSAVVSLFFSHHELSLPFRSQRLEEKVGNRCVRVIITQLGNSKSVQTSSMLGRPRFKVHALHSPHISTKMLTVYTARQQQRLIRRALAFGGHVTIDLPILNIHSKPNQVCKKNKNNNWKNIQNKDIQ